LITILPSLATNAGDTFVRLSRQLSLLLEHGDVGQMRQQVEGMIDILDRFLGRVGRRFGGQLDDDFFSGFAYRSDGSLYGQLWRSLPDSASKIHATVRDRAEGRKNWIKDSVVFKAYLGKHRRARVQAISSAPPPPEIPAKASGCVCKEKWSVWVWRWLPIKRSFKGCGSFPVGYSMSGVKGNVSAWPGFCRVQQKRHTLARCRHKFAACDPSQTRDERPTYRIWRSSAMVPEQVYLPLVQMDFFFHISARNSRADFCTPNFAPLMIQQEWYWSAYNWIPYELRRSSCAGARLHPPGASILITRCAHSGGKNKPNAVNLKEWQIVGTFYMVSYYNTWGTGDGDLMKDWFTGSWTGGASAGKWGSIEALSSSAWTTQADGFGYLSTENVLGSKSGFWLAVVAELTATFQTSAFLNGASGDGSKRSSKWGRISA